MNDFRIISADDHIAEARDLWEKRLPRGLKDKGPRLVELPDKSGHCWVVPGQPNPRPLGLDVMAGRKYEEYKATGVHWEEIRPGCYDPAERLKDLDIGGIYATVLYPNVMLGFDGGRHTGDWELALAMVRAYNDHLAEFCAEDPERLIGMALVPLENAEVAVAEIERVSTKTGIRGILLPVYPSPELAWNDPQFEPIWAAAAHAGLSVSIHIGLPRGLSGNPLLMGSPGTAETFIHLAPLTTTEPVAFLLWSGLFDRYPDLTLVSVESGIGWLAYFLQRADSVYERHRYWTHAQLKNEPGYYFGRNIFATFEEDIVGIQTRHLMPVETFMWSSDYPHTDTSWPNCRENIEEHFKGVPEEDRRKVVHENAARVYGLK